jgi:hypothetical protein
MYFLHTCKTLLDHILGLWVNVMCVSHQLHLAHFELCSCRCQWLRFTFEATLFNIEVLKGRTLTAKCDLDDRTLGQTSKLDMNVFQCKCMVDTILASKYYLMNKTCTTWVCQIYKELFWIVKKADLIMQGCSDGQTPSSAKTLPATFLK